MRSKYNPRRQINQRDLERAQKKLDAKVEAMKLEAAYAATESVQQLFYLALTKPHNFKAEDIAKLQEEADRLAMDIAEGRRTIPGVKDELEEIGVYFAR